MMEPEREVDLDVACSDRSTMTAKVIRAENNPVSVAQQLGIDRHRMNDSLQGLKRDTAAMLAALRHSTGSVRSQLVMAALEQSLIQAGVTMT